MGPLPDGAPRDLVLAAGRLRDRALGFVIVRDGLVLAESADPGLGALVQAADDLRARGIAGVALADRIAGAAAVAVAAWAGVRMIFAEVASEAAAREARARGVAFTSQRQVPRILNRRGDGPCPFEVAVEAARTGGAGLDGMVAAVRATSARLAARRPDAGRADGRRRGLLRTSADVRYAVQTHAAAGVGLAMALALPLVVHAVGLGPTLLPMHLPVLLMGALGGARVGCLVGAVAPALSHLLTGMPPVVPPVAPLMMVELATYGLVAGVVRGWVRAYGTPPGRARTQVPLHLSLAREYVWLVPTLAAGRLALGTAAAIIGPALGLKMSAVAYLQAALVTGVPGIVIQLVVVPTLVARIERTMYPRVKIHDEGGKERCTGSRDVNCSA
ncbi:MAG: ECF transporter S component [Armatimonadota bacterium]|nr:ECF transporter S component [Armatimonadota bacterium]MDR7518119.1 ECF transporter S component [Armatimonadota bacterium]MDR7548710.1 ECF transporter S component [Armatimonadota bacterium]